MADFSPLYSGRQVKSECKLFLPDPYVSRLKSLEKNNNRAYFVLLLNSGERNVLDGKYLLFLYHYLKMLWLQE